MSITPDRTELPKTAEIPVEFSTAVVTERARQELHMEFSAIVAGDFDAAGRGLLAVLALLDEVPLAGVSNDERLAMGQIIDTVLAVFCLPDFVVAEEHGFLFLRYNVLIANLMEGCLQTTTDHHIIKVQQHPQAVFKTLVLYSAQNNQSVDIASLLVANPDLVSRWLFQTWKVIFSGNCSQNVTANLQRFLSQMDHRILPAVDMQELYFGCTCPGIPEERRAKELINQAIQKYVPAQAENRPVADCTTVFSRYCSKRHSMHRTLAQYIAALKPHCHLKLLHSLRESHDLNTPLLHVLIRIPCNDSSVDISRNSLIELEVRSFAKVRMTLPSLLMVNLHRAPLLALQMYYEQFVLWPGYSAEYKLPPLPRQFRQNTASEVINNLSPYAQKPPRHWLESVNAAIRACQNRIRSRVFAAYAPINPKGHSSSLNPVSLVMTAAGNEPVSDLTYPDYRTLMKDGDFAIDLYPAARSIAPGDIPHLRKSSPARESSRCFYRTAPATPRSAGNSRCNINLFSKGA